MYFGSEESCRKRARQLKQELIELKKQREEEVLVSQSINPLFMFLYLIVHLLYLPLYIWVLIWLSWLSLNARVDSAIGSLLPRIEAFLIPIPKSDLNVITYTNYQGVTNKKE